jgi:NADH-quinone oxidoreductase subunit J
MNHSIFQMVCFIAFAVVAVGAALAVVSVKNTVHGVLALVLTFFSTACLWMLAEAEFLALALVVVYVGAVMVLFLFVVMMLDINLERVREGFWRNLPLALVVGGIMVIEMVLIIGNRIWATAPKEIPPGYSNTKELGRVMYTQYAYAFEIAAVLLLVAIIAAIALTLRQRKDTRRQDPSQQVKARPAERVRLVSMKAEADQ